MSQSPRNTEGDRAADAFYGQPEAVFSRQVEQMCRNDERLIAVFKQTRSVYIRSKNTGNSVPQMS